jgi:hypothetical protein
MGYEHVLKLLSLAGGLAGVIAKHSAIGLISFKPMKA